MSPSVFTGICTNLLLPLADLATRQRTMQMYRFYREAQWWDRDRLLEYRNARLAETVRLAVREVPLYRELYRSAGVEGKPVATADDLSSLPAVSKEALRGAYPERCTRNTDWPWREYCTSGSSGTPFAVRVDNLTMSHARALMFLRANFSGWEVGEPFLQTGMTLDRGIVKRCKDLLLRVRYVSAFNLSDAILDRYLQLVEDKKLRYIMGYAGSLYCLAARAAETGFNRKLDGLVSWGDNLYAHYREKIEGALGCRVTDTYGCGEGIQIAAQCGMGEGGYHVFMPHVVVEVVDDEGHEVKPGQVGNIVLTRLDPGAMPLIRYKVGDLGRKSAAESCPCGRGFEMLSRIEGRDTDVVVTPNGNRLIVHFFTGILEYYQSVHTFRVVQERREGIMVEIVPRPDFCERHWQDIKKEILEKGDPDLDVQLKIVEEIRPERSNKRRFVVSRVRDSLIPPPLTGGG